MLDHELAARLGATLLAVKSRRFELGITAINPRKKWTAAEEALVGTMPDAKLAEKLGRTVVGVALKRRAFGIPEFQENHE
jgi:hypothetical protein